ncbi:MAG: creatininase family protein [Clostridiaceae bacterium]|nr:creatininase family protein [Clostridiaceae bacterium]
MRLEHLTWIEAQKYCSTKNSGLIIPIGTCEQHGHHLPLNNDILVCEYMADELSKRTRMLIAPTINYGVNLPLDRGLAGTASITEKTLHDTLSSIIDWWTNQGFTFFLLLTYHGDPFHIKALSGHGSNVKLIELGDVDYRDILQKQDTIRHACEAETSVALFLYPDKVRMEAIQEYDIPFSDFKDYLYHDAKFPPKQYTGCLGAPSCAVKEKGAQIVHRMIENMMEEYQRFEADLR